MLTFGFTVVGLVFVPAASSTRELTAGLMLIHMHKLIVLIS